MSQLIVEIGANVARLQRDMNTMNRQVGSTTASMKRAFRGLGVIIAGTFSIRAVTNFARSSVRAFGDVERAQLRLSRQVELTGAAAWTSAEQIEDMVNRIDRATLASADGLRQAASLMLISADVTEQNFERSIKVATDLAEVAGIQLPAAGRYLTRAMGDISGAMSMFRRYGIELDDTLKDNIESLVGAGRQTEAFELLLGGLEDRIGGAAEAAGVGLSGALDDTGVSVRLLREAIGEGLTPIVLEINKEFAEWVDTNREFIAQDAAEHVRKITDQIRFLMDIYKSIPPGIVGPAGLGLLGTMLLGPKAGLFVAIIASWTSAINSLFDLLGEPTALRHLDKQIADTMERIAQLERSIRQAPEISADYEYPRQLEEARKQLELLRMTREKLVRESRETPIMPEVVVRGTRLEDPQSVVDDYNEIWNGVLAVQRGIREQEEEEARRRVALITEQNADIAHEVERLYIQTRTPFEQYMSQYERLSELLEMGAIDHDLYVRAVSRAQQGIRSEVDETVEGFSRLQHAIEGWGMSSAQAITDFATGAEGSFKRMIDSMISDLLRMMIYQQITGPLFSHLGGMAGGLFGNAHGNAFINGGVTRFAMGGIVNSPTVFPMKTGTGLMGEAGPEAIMPLTRIGGDLGVKATGGGATVNIYNNVGAEITTQERQGSQGPEVDVIIDRMTAKHLGTLGTQSNRTMRKTFGAQEGLVRR